MAGSARISDFLYLHANVSRRVRNLETGVHPTSTEGGYEDVYLPTEVNITNAKFRVALASTAEPRTPKWQRRFGVVSMLGGVEPVPGVTWSGIGSEEVVLTLPAPARPITELVFLGAALDAPWAYQYRVKPDGELSVIKPAGISGTTAVKFEGGNWTAD